MEGLRQKQGWTGDLSRCHSDRNAVKINKYIKLGGFQMCAVVSFLFWKEKEFPLGYLQTDKQAKHA